MIGLNSWTIETLNRGQSDTFILDFEKSFDTPTYELLKSKLFSYGIGGRTLKWIDSFLCFRQQPTTSSCKWSKVRLGPSFCRVSPRALFMVPCCSLFTLMISHQILRLKYDFSLMTAFAIAKLRMKKTQRNFIGVLIDWVAGQGSGV